MYEGLRHHGLINSGVVEDHPMLPPGAGPSSVPSPAQRAKACGGVGAPLMPAAERELFPRASATHPLDIYPARSRTVGMGG